MGDLDAYSPYTSSFGDEDLEFIPVGIPKYQMGSMNKITLPFY